MLKPLVPLRVTRKEFRPPSLTLSTYRGIRPGDTVKVPGTAADGSRSSVRSSTATVERIGKATAGGPTLAWLVGGGEPVAARDLRKVSGG